MDKFRSPIEEAEEWAIHDYEGFEGAEVGEYFSFANVVELADYIRERGELGAQVLNYYGGNMEDAKSRFDEYAGEYDSLADYAEELTEQSGETIPERLAPYINYKAMAHDYEQSGDFLTFEVSGSVRHNALRQGTIYTQMGDDLDAQDAAHLQTLCDKAGFEMRRVA